MARSRKFQSQQITLPLYGEDDSLEEGVKPRSLQSGLRDYPAQTNETTHEAGSGIDLMNLILASENMNLALERVKENKGAPGIDGMTTDQVLDYLFIHWKAIRASILAGTYQPQPVKRVEIPKPNGGTRLLGIPTVLDRLIQQAILQILTKIFDPDFSPHSYGFRPGLRGHDAVREARKYMNAGYRWVVDIDLEKFFDRVNHDILMSRLARKVSDKCLLKLIRKFLESGILINGILTRSEEGTPQGGPLSPLLSNIVLDDLDKELTERGHKFVRYADDCNIYVRTRRSGERVKASITAFLENRLHLKVNESKSAVDRPWNRKFLGFTIARQKNQQIRISNQSRVRVKDKIRSYTQRSKAISMPDRIERLNQYLQGWVGYYALSDGLRFFKELDSWIRRRLRMCLWKQWKRARTRVRELRALGLKEDDVWSIALSSKGSWRISWSPPLHKGLNNAYWQKLGLLSLEAQYQSIRKSW